MGADPADRGTDGGPLTPTSLLGGAAGADRTGLYALEDVDLFGLLVIPPDLPAGDVDPVVVSAAHAYCQKRRAILLLDGPTAWSTAPNIAAAAAAGGLGAIGANAAVYVPRIQAANPLHGDQVEAFPAAGAIAGLLARTDARRGVWKAPAGRRPPCRGVRTGQDTDHRRDRGTDPTGHQLPARAALRRSGGVGGAHRRPARAARVVTGEVPNDGEKSGDEENVLVRGSTCPW